MRKRPWLYVAGAVVLVFAIGFGALGGAAITYYVTRVRPVQAAGGLTPVAEDNGDGLLIAAVAEDSAAAAAGLKRGDILLEIDGTAVNTLPELQQVLSELSAGDTVTLTVQRGDAVQTLEATLADRDGQAYLGINTCGGRSGGMVFGEPAAGVVPGAPFQEAMVLGARITEVVTGSPAEKAGLAVDDLIISVGGEDVIVSVDGEDVGPAGNLAALIQSYSPGNEVALSVVSAGSEETRDVTVTLGENPDQEGQAYLGIRYAPSASMREFNGQLPDNFDPREFFRNMPGMPSIPGMPRVPGMPGTRALPEGVESAAIIGEVTPGTPAEEAGLVKGDVILAIDGEAVDGPAALVAAVADRQPGDEVTLTLYRDGQETDVTVVLAENPDSAGAAYIGVMVTGFVQMNRNGGPGGMFNFDFGDRFKAPEQRPDRGRLDA